MTAPGAATREIEAGLNAHRLGNFEFALSCYRRALLVNPGSADALNLAGVALHQLGDSPQGLENLLKAARLRRNDPAILANLGQVCAALGRHTEAEDAYRKASRIDAREPNYQMGLANALAQQGKHKDAETLFERLTHRYPDQPMLWFNRGNVLRDLGRAEDSIDSYRRALALQPANIDARNNLAGVLHAVLRFDEAEREYRACIAADAEYLPARASLASLLIDVGRDAEAEMVCREILQIHPGHVETWLMLACAQNHQGRVNAQLDTVRAAAMRAPDNAKILKALAGAMFDLGDFAEGMRVINQVQAIEPDEEARQDVLAGALLACGTIEAAWICYRHRPGPGIFRTKNPGVALSNTLPPELRGKQVFVHREQGLGDELFFLRYAPRLAAMGARITYRAGAKLRTLLERVPCLDVVLPEDAPLPEADVVMIVGDLPHALTPADAAQHQLAQVSALEPGQTLSFGQSEHERYPQSLLIPPLPQRMDELRQRLANAGPPPYLGLTWRAGIPPREQGADGWVLYKVAATGEFAAVAGTFNGTLLALQRAPQPGEIAAFAQAAGRPVHDFSDLNDDLEGMLALLALIDEYAGVSNTNMHLRAAAGKTARVLLPAPAEWRWMTTGAASPWFPGFSLYRQDNDGSWAPAWAALKRDLARA